MSLSAQGGGLGSSAQVSTCTDTRANTQTCRYIHKTDTHVCTVKQAGTHIDTGTHRFTDTHMCIIQCPILALGPALPTPEYRSLRGKWNRGSQTPPQITHPLVLILCPRAVTAVPCHLLVTASQLHCHGNQSQPDCPELWGFPPTHQVDEHMLGSQRYSMG